MKAYHIMTTIANTRITIIEPYVPSRSAAVTTSAPMSSTPQPTPIQHHDSHHSRKHSIENVIKSQGYIPLRCCAKTLQGSIWKALNKTTNDNNVSCVIKVTKKSLHDKSMAIVRGEKIKIHENILKETAILRHLTTNQPPSALTKFIDFFHDKYHYYLVMEDAGTDLFDFVVKAHHHIAKGTLQISEWHKFCKIAMKQMIELMDWMHSTMHCCHLDLSLENFVISDDVIKVQSNGKNMLISPDFQVKLIDFGLAEVFQSTNQYNQISFRCTKYCGKTAYKAPEVFKQKEIFDARCADCWSLGVCSFMMMIGCGPWNKPSKRDPCYAYIMSGRLKELLIGWKKRKLVTDEYVDLLYSIFTEEKHRLTMTEIALHPWLL